MPILSKFLTEQGLLPSPTNLTPSQPFPINNYIHVGVSANEPILYLPFNPTKKNRSRTGDIDAEANGGDLEDEEGDQDQSDEEDHPNRNKQQELHHNVTSHTFAIVVKLDRNIELTPIIKVNYHTDAGVCWSGSEKSKRQPFNDRFRVSENINWDLDLKSPNAFIPIKNLMVNSIDDQLLGSDDDDEDDDLSANNLDNMDDLNNNNIQYGLTSAQQKIKPYIPLEPKNYVMEPGGIKPLDDETLVETNLFQNFNKPSQKLEAGTYIFLLPVVYPTQTPETVNIPNGSVVHNLDIQIQLPPKRDLRVPQTAVLSTSPGHLHNAWGEVTGHLTEELNSSIAPNNTSSGGSKSIFKRIGIRRNSNASLSKSLASSPPIRLRSGSGSGSGSGILSPLATSRRSSVTKVEERVMNFRYVLPVVRLPPSDATSTLNKSIYVNKVWNKALAYEIIMPKKFTILTAPDAVMRKQEAYEKRGAHFRHWNHMKRHTVGLQVKLVPLVKGIQLKRVKVNIVEKITYTSLSDSGNSLRRSPTQDGDNNYNTSMSSFLGGPMADSNEPNVSKKKGGNTRSNSRVKERVVPLYEIHAKSSSKKPILPPLYTQSIKSCKNDNLLTFCYNFEHHEKNNVPNSGGVFSHKMSKLLDSSMTSKESTEHKDDDVVISNPIKLDVPVTFIANDEKKYIQRVWDWLNKSQRFNESDELNFGMAIIDDPSRRNSITTMRSRVGSITSMGSIGSGHPTTSNNGIGIGTGSGLDKEFGNALSVVGSPNTVIPYIITTNENGMASSFSSSQPTHSISHQDNTSFLGSMFGHHTHQQHNNNLHPLAEQEDRRRELYTFFPDVTTNNLKVRHRLQLAFRISKPDEVLKLADGSPKMHHYEVIVDSPIAFVSPLVDGEGNLPSYESAVGGFNPLSIVPSTNTSISTGEVVLQPISPMMSNTGTLMGTYSGGSTTSGNPPRYSENSVSSSSIDLLPTTIPKKGGVATSLLSTALRRDHSSLNKVLFGVESDNGNSLDYLLARNPSRSSLEFQRKIETNGKPPCYDDVILSDGLEHVGLLSDQSDEESEDVSGLDEGGDDNMSLCTGI